MGYDNSEGSLRSETCVLAMGQTVVLLTHDPMAASYADRVLLLADGRLAGELDRPTPDSVLTAIRALAS